MTNDPQHDKKEEEEEQVQLPEELKSLRAGEDGGRTGQKKKRCEAEY